jgi:hypothetical protein
MPAPAVYNQDSFNGGVTTAAYGVATNNTPPFVAGPPFPASNPGPNLGGGDQVRSTTLAGTSFSAPLVAGAGAVISQYGLLATATGINSNIENIPFSRNATDPLDHRVLKAILMNGAAHTNVDGTQLTRSNGTPWTRTTNLQGGKALPAPLAGLAVGPVSVQAQSGLDPQLGTGQLNLLGSLNNYAAGEQGPGAPGAAAVQPIGWDFETVAGNAPANTLFTYNYNVTGTSADFQASLAWDAVANIQNPTATNNFQPSGTPAMTSSFANTTAPLDLDLYFFHVNPNGTLQELSWSNSNVDNQEYIFYQPTMGALADGTYQLDVVAPNGGMAGTPTPYGLAWNFAAVPEPASVWMLILPLALLWRRRKAINA